MPDDFGDFAYFALIYQFLRDEIDDFGNGLMRRFAAWASAAALSLLTLWIMQRGFRILSGGSREPIMGVVMGLARNTVVVAASSTMAVAGTDLQSWLTVGLDKEIHYAFTGKRNSGTADSIDKTLALTQVAISIISGIQVTSGDAEAHSLKERAIAMATVGTAAPPMAAAAMLLLYQFGISLFIGLGPLFILCLLFEQSKELFRRWLLYGIGTLFSMALLSVVCNIVLKLTYRVGEAFWLAKVAGWFLKIDSESLTFQAMQQGGIGVLLTVLVISVPPMAAMFFQGTLGHFMAHSAFHSGTSPRPHGLNAGSTPHSGQPYGHGTPTRDGGAMHDEPASPRSTPDPGVQLQTATRVSVTGENPGDLDVIKTDRMGRA